MSEPALAAHLGYPGGALAERYPATTVLNHEWWDPDTFVTVGTIPADRIAELSDGLLRETVDVRVNRAVVEHDVTLIVGPGVPARGRRLLRRQQVPLPRGRPARRSSTSRTGSAR